jgi:hypothetical protein
LWPPCAAALLSRFSFTAQQGITVGDPGFARDGT